MAGLNKVLMIGNLTRNPELRYIPSGTAVTTFTVATSRRFKTASGEQRDEVCFVRVVVWGRRAEVCAEYLSKGSPVFVEGRLQSRNWQAADGTKRSTIEVIAQDVQFLSRAPKAEQQAPPEPLMPEEEPIQFEPNAEGQDIPAVEDSDSESNKDKEVPF